MDKEIVQAMLKDVKDKHKKCMVYAFNALNTEDEAMKLILDVSEMLKKVQETIEDYLL